MRCSSSTKCRRKKIAVVLDDGMSPQVSRKMQRNDPGLARPGSLIENLNHQPPGIPAHPFVENGAEEIAEASAGTESG